MKELVRGLYEGAPGDGAAPGRSRDRRRVRAPEPSGHPWLQGPSSSRTSRTPSSWSFMRGKVRWLLHEAYADTRNHGVPGSTLDERRSHLEDYVFHLRELARAGGEHTTTVDRFLNDTFVPFINGGGFHPSASAATRSTSFPGTGTPSSGRSDDGLPTPGRSTRCGTTRRRIAASRWPRRSASRGSPEPLRAPLGSVRSRGQLQAARLAEAFRWSCGPGSTLEGACVAPGSVVDWCTSERAGAFFIETWPAFRSGKVL